MKPEWRNPETNKPPLGIPLMVTICETLDAFELGGLKLVDCPVYRLCDPATGNVKYYTRHPSIDFNDAQVVAAWDFWPTKWSGPGFVETETSALNEPVKSSDLSTRSYFALTRGGLHTWGDVLEWYRDRERRHIRNLGKKSEAEIRIKLVELGLTKGI